MATVIVDVREKKSRVPTILQELGVKVIYASLPVGDYSPTPGILIERKTVTDFISSIKRKRFQRQLQELREASEKTLIIIEGKHLFSTMGMSQTAIMHTLAIIVIGYGIPVIFTENSLETAKFLKTIAARENIDVSEMRSLFFKRKAISPEDEVLRVVESIPGIGPKMARALLKKFKNLKSLINATPAELMSVEGFGKKRVDKFLEFIEREFHEENGV